MFFFYMRPVGDLGGVVDPDVGCAKHRVIAMSIGAMPGRDFLHQATLARPWMPRGQSAQP